MSNARDTDRRLGASTPGSGRELEDCGAGLDRLSSRLDQCTLDTRSFSAFAALEPQISNVSKLVSEELSQIESTERELSERYRSHIDQHKRAQERLQQLEEAHDEHATVARDLAIDLECITEELDRMKRKMDEKASSATDATPLVDIRAAIQRLKKENKQLDFRVGILDHQCHQARKANPQEPSEDEHSFDDDE